MRRIILPSLLLVMLVPVAARAQATPPIVTPQSTSGWTGLVDFGGRSTFGSGDGARYERYRDLGDGLFLDLFQLDRAQGDWLIAASGVNVGRLDQRYGATVSLPGRLKVYGQWDQIPMLMSRTTSTMFVEDFGQSPSVMTIPNAIQLQMQTTPAASRPGVFDANSFVFDTRLARHIGSAGAEYIATPELTLKAYFSSTRRSGTLPYGGSFGHSSLVEMPAPVLHTTRDFDGNAEYARGNLLLRGGFTGSWFQNDATTVEFDNPFRATDIPGTPAHGRSSLAPSNSFLGANAMVSIKLPRRSRATAYASFGTLRDVGDALMPQTINSATQASIAPLPRNQVEGEARTMGLNFSFTSRPWKFLDVNARYRLYDYDNRTPEFILPQRVAYDNTPAPAVYQTLGGGLSPLVVETEPFGVMRSSFDIEARTHITSFGATAFGFTRLTEDRAHRFFETTAENIVRVTYDAVTHSLFTVRAKYEHGQKRGEVTEDAERALFNIGEQPELRHFDIASRDRDRVTVIGSFMPAGMLTLHGSAAAGRDDYQESRFGLRDNRHQVYTTGADFAPGEHVVLNASYSYERYDSLQHSRMVAAPPSGANVLTYEQFLIMSSQPGATQAVADSRYDWASNGADRVHSAIFSIEIGQFFVKNLDLRVSYDYNRARSLYTYSVGDDIPLRTLPEDIDPSLTALPPPTQLPLVRSEIQRGTFDAVYSFNTRVAIGLSYWYEAYAVSDFTLDIDANPEQARGSTLLLGYMYQPYAANTVWGRLIIRW